MAVNSPNQPLGNMESKARWFVFWAVLLLLLLLALIAARQGYFRQSTTLYFFAPNAQGLSKGMAVKFIGFRIGSVEEVVMQPNATVQVKLALNNDYLHFIGVDAKARLLKEGLVGESVVEIVPGSPHVRQIEQNGVLTFERARDVGDLAESVVAQVTPILSDVKQLTANINDPKGDVAQILKNVNALTASLRETTTQVNELLKNGNDKINAVYDKAEGVIGRVNQALDQTNAGLGTAVKTLNQVNEAMPGVLSKVDATLVNVQGVTADVKKITAESAEQIPPLVRSSNALVQDSQALLHDARQSWPLRNMGQGQVEQVLPLDGYVAPHGMVKP